jgi:hypothetical protein
LGYLYPDLLFVNVAVCLTALVDQQLLQLGCVVDLLLEVVHQQFECLRRVSQVRLATAEVA